MRLSYLSIIICLFITPLHGYDFTRHTDNLEESPFFDTTFVADYSAVNKVLKEEEGFTEVFFPTPGGHILQGLLRSVPNPDFTMIFCSGFLPGKQEGVATFITMLPQNCNILFFNGRGKGRSTGFLAFLNLLNYGRYDYLDTIGAIEYAHFINDGPLFLHGVCAGAFHATHALINLQDKIHTYNIKGLVCDSTWPSVDGATIGMFDYLLAQKPSYFKNLGIKAARLFACSIIAPLMRRHAHETDLSHKIAQLTVPVLYIHSYDDTLTNITPVQHLAHATRAKTCWWIEEQSKHTCHHLKHKYAYAETLKQFLCKHL